MRNFTISLSSVLLALCAPAKAEQTPADRNIGSATLIEKTVEGMTSDRNMRLKVGDAVYFNELLTTALESQGKFVFDDRATLQMGPQSQVRLDSFVYKGETASAPAVAFNVAKGALRLMSAPGNHKPYEVRTRNASIGVRGTAFAVRSLESRTDAVLYEGIIDVCLPNGGACRTLDKPCTTLAVTDAGFVETREVGAKDWTFDAQCRPMQPAPRRRHGAAEPPASAPPPLVTPRHAASTERGTPPRKLRVAHVEPPKTETFRPRPPRLREVAAEPIRPRWPKRPRRPPVYDDPEPEYTDYPPPRVTHYPVRPPIVFGGGIFRPHFGGGFGGGWGGPRPGGMGYPQGPRQGGSFGGGNFGGGMRGGVGRF